MTLLSTQEIKHCSIFAFDKALAHAPVHIIKNNQPQYVVLSEAAIKTCYKRWKSSPPLAFVMFAIRFIRRSNCMR